MRKKINHERKEEVFDEDFYKNLKFYLVLINHDRFSIKKKLIKVDKKIQIKENKKRIRSLQESIYSDEMIGGKQ